jgi:menaquinone-specific isochorismate synthase
MESTRSDGQPTVSEADSGVVRGCTVDGTPVRSLLRVVDEPRLAWGSATETVAAGGSAMTLSANGPNRFEQIRERATTLFDRLELVDSVPARARPRLFGGFAFTGSDADGIQNGPWTGYADAQFVLPAVQLTVSSDGVWLTTAETGENAGARASSRLDRWRDRINSLPELVNELSPGIDTEVYTPTRADWRRQTRSVVERITDGGLRKVVLAQALSVQLQRSVPVADVLGRLGQAYPSCHRFLFQPQNGKAFFGATPERLVRLRGDTVDTEALAGSIGRGETKDEDEWLASQLRESEKNAQEHDIVVEAIREQLDGLATDIETGTRTVRKLTNVQHLQTPIRATLTGEEHVLSLVEALHPTPAVGGLPPDEALETISDSEAFDRGWYAAPVGWFDANGDGTFAVGIRSAVANGSEATLFAGAGIVSDSDPDEEWDELQLKYRPILDELTRQR